jgi:glyoxylase-like metal-dependent hydrolase (beta-lactamase superfamily II)
MKIHAIQTGTVRVKQSQRMGQGPGPLRQLHVLFDSTWTEPLPIFAWAVETAEGVLVVDTGETAKTREPGYFPPWHPYFRFAVRIDVKPEQEIGPRLLEIGIRPDDVRTVIMTHLHTDHAGGLHYFPKSEILVSDTEYRIAKGFAGRLRGYLPNRWPKWFHPKPIPLRPEPFGTFDRCFSATRDGTVVVVPTQGHTPGHVSVIVVDDDVSYFLAGDATYTQRALLEQKVDGVSPSKAEALRTLERILAYARSRPTVYLPSHDPQSIERLDFSTMIESPDGAQCSAARGS